MWEVHLELIHGVPPLRGPGLADRILLSEEAGLVDGLIGWHVVEPLDPNKILALLRVIRELPEIFR